MEIAMEFEEKYNSKQSKLTELRRFADVKYLLFHLVGNEMKLNSRTIIEPLIEKFHIKPQEWRMKKLSNTYLQQKNESKETNSQLTLLTKFR